MLDVHHVPDRPGRRADPRKTQTGNTSGEGQTGACAPTRRPRCGRGTSRNCAARRKGIYFHLYVLIDIFSRFNPGWLVSTCEESHLAADFIADAIARNGAAPHTRPRRPGHLDDVEAGVDVADRSGRHPHPFPTARVE